MILKIFFSITDRTTWVIETIAILVVIEIIVTVVRTSKIIDWRWFQLKDFGFWRENKNRRIETQGFERKGIDWKTICVDDC